MSADPAAPERATTVAGAVNTLRARGLRVSAARRLVLEALSAAAAPVTAADVASGLGGRLPASDLGSVYRNLDVLEGAGLVRHVRPGRGPALYALAGGRPRGYVACEGCGAVLSFTPEELAAVRRAVEELCGFTARFSHAPLPGLCRDCAS